MDSSDKRTIIAVVSNFKFLKKNFNNLYNQLRRNGNYHGEILVITSKFSPCFLIKSIRKKNQIKVLRFKNIKFDKNTEFELNNLQTFDDPNRNMKSLGKGLEKMKYDRLDENTISSSSYLLHSKSCCRLPIITNDNTCKNKCYIQAYKCNHIFTNLFLH